MSISNKQKSNVEYWESKRNKIETNIGKWTGGKDVICHGYSMMNELLGHVSYMQMIVLNITGRMISVNLSKWLEGNFIGVSYPDSRIWCNQIAALAGTSKTSVVAATVAGTLAADSRAYGGGQTSKIGMHFIQNALLDFDSGSTIEQILSKSATKNNKPIISGYARPIRRIDERIPPHQKMTKQLGFDIGKHLSLAYKIDSYLETKFGLGMNIAGYSCAFLSDQGFTPNEMYQIKALMVSSGVTACFIDNIKNEPHTFLPLHCEDILYDGPEHRDLI